MATHISGETCILNSCSFATGYPCNSLHQNFLNQKRRFCFTASALPLRTAWIGGKRIDLAQSGSVPLETGSNKLTLRVATTPGTDQEVQVEVGKTQGSPRRIEVLGGQ